MIAIQERRSSPRARVQVRLELVLGDGSRGRFFTRSLSAQGTRCVGRATLASGTEVSGTLYLPLVEDRREYEIPVELRLRVVHAFEGGGGLTDLGLAFLEIDRDGLRELEDFLLDALADDGCRGTAP